MVLCPYRPAAGTGPASAAVEHRRLQFRLNRLHPLTGGGRLHRQHVRGWPLDPLIPTGPEATRKRLKAPDKPGLWQIAAEPPSACDIEHTLLKRPAEVGQ